MRTTPLDPDMCVISRRNQQFFSASLIFWRVL